MAASSGSWRPIMAASAGAGSPVTAPKTVTGAPRAPNATGVVLKISTNTSASSVGKPHMMSSEAVMATGAPNPATPSSSAPKQKPMAINTTRRSFGKCLITQARKASKRPDETATL